MSPPYRLLLVTEDPELSRSLSDVLSHHGFDVFATDDTELVVDLFQSLGPFEVVVLSEDLPRTRFASKEHWEYNKERLASLRDVLDRLRGEGHSFQTVLLSREIGLDDAGKLGVGVSAVVWKPFRFEDLGPIIREVIAGA